jgi:hypothetical protein
MGRKLNFFEVDDFGAVSDHSAAARAVDQAHRHQEIQLRITKALGISLEELNRTGDQPAPGPKSLSSSDTVSAALNRDCSAMVQVFAGIKDPDERRRLIKSVEDAARKSSSNDPS